MTPRYELELDHLAVGLTKPPMKLGVPLMPFYLSILFCFFGWMFYQVVSGTTSLLSILVFILIWCGLYLAMLFMTFNDVFGLAIAWINFIYFRQHTTHAFWGNTDSYAP